MGDLITMDDLSNKEITNLLDNAERLLPVAKGEIHLPLLEGKVLANMFFENSTRTRMSFESAMKRLGVVEEIGYLLVAQIVHRDEVAHRLSSAKPGACRLCVLLWPSGPSDTTPSAFKHIIIPRV
jgi:ornithine carbamoyltransferase